MKNNFKLSLSFLNSISLFIFMTLISLGVYFWAYLSTQKAVDYNINEYFTQTQNIINLILDEEKKELNDMAFEAAQIIQNSNFHDELITDKIDNLISVDQVDLLFLKKDEKIVDYSNSIFETKSIIEKIKTKVFILDNIIVSLNTDEQTLLIMLSQKKIINKINGRVDATLFAGKILNDNFTILNNLKTKASLDDVYLYSKDELIATTANRFIIDMKVFKGSDIFQKENDLYFNYMIETSEDGSLNIVLKKKNSTFELVRNDFENIGYIFFFFLLFIFILLYIFSNRIIIKPFSRLLNFAKRAKDDDAVRYEGSNVKEFNNFALEIKSIIDELRDMKEQYIRAIEGVEDGLWDINLKDNTSFFSNKFLEMLGYSKNDCKNSMSFWKENIHPEDYKKTLRKLALHLKGKSALYEDNYRFKCKNGDYRWVKVRGKVFFDEFGTAIRVTGFHSDIDKLVKLESENQKKEQMLYQQSKLASMGEMIGNIAHQWRQPLNVISTVASAQIMQQQLGLSNKKEIETDLNKIIDTVKYLSTIIDKFRNFFNPNKEMEEFCIKSIITENLEIFESSYKSHNIIFNFDLIPKTINGYKFELVQVIVNIVNNARDALISNYEFSEEKYIFIKSYVKKKSIIIKIYDNAGGIDKVIKEKIYDPYFTTKHQSQGTGLGLYMSSEIIKKHFNGELTNETIEYKYKGKMFKGEEFKIKIPLNS